MERTLDVLMIEDDPGDAALIRTLLAHNGDESYRLTHRDRLAAGLEVLAAGGVDLVLLDFSLPDSVGIAGFHAVRERHPEVPVIILTSLDDDAVAARAVAEGAQDYLVKREVDRRSLSRAIRYALGRHASEEALRRSQERYALAVEGSHDGLWDWDVVAGTVYLSRRWKAMLGYADGEIGSRFDDWLALVPEDDRARLAAALTAHLQGQGEQVGAPHFTFEHRMRQRSGELRWMLTRGAAVRDAAGRVRRMAGSLTDITERKRAEEQLLHDAFHDGLTGLANRALLFDRIKLALAAGERHPTRQFAVIFLDVDRFKNINDSLGHAAGDQLLVAIARRLQDITRPGDTVVRLGGDEFAMMLVDARDVTAGAHVAERILSRLGEPFTIAGAEVYTSASIGIAHSRDSEPTPEAILRDADLAMYRAKAGGRNRYEVFDAEMHQAAVQLLKMETDLRRAVANHDFVMHYQPIVALDSGRIVGFEALVRWQHADRGLVAPANFIGLAEETGLIVPLGWHVLESACRQCRAWQDRFPANPPYFMSVNTSGKLFGHPGAVDRVLRILEETRLAPESLRLEVTESVVLDEGEEVTNSLLQLRAFGVQLSIDDFGTGYSSLSYLQRFRYDSLKIDRSFVHGMGATGDSQTIVETILSLASHLGIGVVAEGVETEEQLARLRSLNCPLGQGYWFARPIEPAAAERLLAANVTW